MTLTFKLTTEPCVGIAAGYDSHKRGNNKIEFQIMLLILCWNLHISGERRAKVKTVNL